MENLNQPPVPPQVPDSAAHTQQEESYTPPVNSGPNPIQIVGRVNFPATQLFEATGFVDTGKQFPTSNAFLMFVPGLRDNSKASGRTYNQAAKEVMKIGVRDLAALAEALHYAATYAQNPDFVVFTDSSKFAGTQGQGQTKQVSVGFAMGNNGKPKVFLNYKGAKTVALALDKWHAIGLAKQLEFLAQETLKSKFEIERAAVR